MAVLQLEQRESCKPVRLWWARRVRFRCFERRRFGTALESTPVIDPVKGYRRGTVPFRHLSPQRWSGSMAKFLRFSPPYPAVLRKIEGPGRAKKPQAEPAAAFRGASAVAAGAAGVAASAGFGLGANFAMMVS